jgi:hypothetical protein
MYADSRSHNRCVSPLLRQFVTPLVGDMDMHWTCVGCPWHEVCLEAVIYDSCEDKPLWLDGHLRLDDYLLFHIRAEPEVWLPFRI